MERHLGHLALHYAPGEEGPARRLLELLGCTLVDNGPRPGADGFCTVLVDQPSATHAENIMFLSPMSPEQAELESAIVAGLAMGRDDEDPAVAAFAAKRSRWPESMAHLGIRYSSLDELEAVVVAVQDAGAPSGELAGRVDVTRYRAQSGVDESIDDRMARSPMFTDDDRVAFAKHWVQCFVRTDLFAYGIRAFGQTIELDYVFSSFFGAVPTFGR